MSDLLDVGDMVEVGGQVGIVESVGIRFTVLVNFAGARVFVPNRSIMNVVSYPKGYIRAYLDVRLPDDAERSASIERRVAELARAAHEQYPGILIAPPTPEGRHETSGGIAFLRVKFRLWPGQGALLEQAVRASVVQDLRQIDADYADWMVSVHYRAEPRDPARRLPRPAALASSRG